MSHICACRITAQVSFTCCVALALLSSHSKANPTPLVEYLFNETGTTAIDSGAAGADLPIEQWDGVSDWISADSHGASGSGPSGFAGDRSYSDPSVILDSGHFSGGYAGDVSVGGVQSLSQMTIQGWFKAPLGQPIGEGESTLIGNLGTSGNDGGWALRTRFDSATLFGRLSFWVGEEEFTQNHSIRLLSDQVYTETDQWIYMAMTYDASTGGIEFFKGSTTNAVATAGTENSGILIGNQIAVSDRNFYIGNGGNESGSFFKARAFNGELDNMRVFNTVLTPTELETLRQNDLLAPSSPYTADFNEDFAVDGTDLGIWEAGYAIDDSADADESGTSDGLDFLEWQLQFGSGVQPLSSSLASVPEPSSAILFFGTALILPSRIVRR